MLKQHGNSIYTSLTHWSCHTWLGLLLHIFVIKQIQQKIVDASIFLDREGNCSIYNLTNEEMSLFLKLLTILLTVVFNNSRRVISRSPHPILSLEWVVLHIEHQHSGMNYILDIKSLLKFKTQQMIFLIKIVLNENLDIIKSNTLIHWVYFMFIFMLTVAPSGINVGTICSNKFLYITTIYKYYLLLSSVFTSYITGCDWSESQLWLGSEFHRPA